MQTLQTIDLRLNYSSVERINLLLIEFEKKAGTVKDVRTQCYRDFLHVQILFTADIPVIFKNIYGHTIVFISGINNEELFEFFLPN